ncbi:MAG: glycosyltransferase family 1 protein [Bacteroidetes bacterium]|nr:MAG: glycosyltransferase family 1 protein [Bacteroidota bacterium]
MRKLLRNLLELLRSKNRKRKKLPAKIAVVTNSSWYTYNFRLGLLRRLKDLGFEVHVIAPKDHFSSKLIAEGFTFTHLPLSIYSINPFKELNLIRSLSKIYRQNQFDFVFHYTAKPNIYGSIAAAFNKIPSIAITTGLGVIRDRKTRISKYVLFFLYRIAAVLSKQVWFLNNDDMEMFLKKRVVKKSKAFLLPSEGVNILDYRPEFENEFSGDRPVKFLYAGRIVWSKGVKEFYQAALHFKNAGINVEFSMLGFIVPEHPDAVSFNLVQQWHKEGVVKYLGETEDVRPYLNETDCLVLPSYFGEGVPRILLEAASMAVPIITTDFVGCREVVDDGVNGFLIQVRDEKDLINKIKMFQELSPVSRFKMGAEGRKKVLREFDEEIIIGHYLQALEHYIQFKGSHKKKSVHL